jgi:NAD-dependent dihydropyrimidine dehydrogenase PreA subunit
MADPYESLAAALDRLPNGFPRTPSGVELRLLARLATPEEASLAALLGREAEPYQRVAERAGLEPDAARRRLVDLAKRGLAWVSKGDGELRFRLAPFIVGLWESRVDEIDHDVVHLFEAYMHAGGAKGIMGVEPALHRVVPGHAAVKTERILPYEDVRALIEAAASFHVQDCICRKEQDIAGGRKCDFPLANCLGLSPVARKPVPGDITRGEALALLDECERLGLVHTVANVKAGVSYVCNCCGCCCGILRGITEFGLAGSMAAAAYRAAVDADACTGCGACVERCQVAAIAVRDGVAVVDAARCIGCGLCVSGCAPGATRLERLPDTEAVAPPEDYAAWEAARLADRGSRVHGTKS